MVVRLLGTLLAVTALAGLIRCSSATMTAYPSSDGLLRLAWSARPERIEDCRPRTEEELAKLPPHMRLPVACEGTTAEYRLQVRIGDGPALDRVVHGGGLRRDRRLYVFEELPVAPGATSVEVTFDRLGSPAGGGPSSSAPRGAANAPKPVPSRPDVAAVPPHLALRRQLQFSPRSVILVTFDPDRRELVVLDGGSGPSR
ncbi:MAG TPA: hypothetical protein VD833_23930 [Vicinamibacterales bacterium]|nr:hypothetical protein [Vicinamibacterales bacterium]